MGGWVGKGELVQSVRAAARHELFFSEAHSPQHSHSTRLTAHRQRTHPALVHGAAAGTQHLPEGSRIHATQAAVQAQLAGAVAHIGCRQAAGLAAGSAGEERRGRRGVVA